MDVDAEWLDLLDHVSVGEAAKADLFAKMGAPDRHYHGREHIALLWHRHRAYRHGLAVPPEPWDDWIACAIAFHDAVYDATRGDNEAASAALFRAAEPDLPPEGVAWVADTILATALHLSVQRPDGLDEAAWRARLWVLDLDLSPLGEESDAFDANTARLRQEYAHLPEPLWQAGRKAFLAAITQVPALYRTPVLADAFEAKARSNLQRELSRPAV